MMDETFCDKILLQTISIRKAQEFAAYNFIFCPSLLYLDLAANENLVRDIQPSSFKTTFTAEEIVKRMIPDRHILYQYHLDLPAKLQNFSCESKTKIVSGGGFHLKEINVKSSIYSHGLERYIVATIENDRKKVEKLRNYMSIIEFLDFREDNEATIFLCDSILTMLYKENCRDSELLRNFFKIFNFCLWLSYSEIPEVFEYVLQQTQRARCTRDLWRGYDLTSDPVTSCFFSHKIQNMHLLIKYGTTSFIPLELPFERNIYSYTFMRAVDRGIVSYPRAYRIFQLFFDFLFHKHSPHGLRCFWRSIKDPFLSTTEIDSILKPLHPPLAKSLIRYYVDYIIGEESCNSLPTPRRLKDLCRVDIRKLLSNNYQLPFGISGLDIPEVLKPYLNLER